MKSHGLLFMPSTGCRMPIKSSSATLLQQFMLAHCQTCKHGARYYTRFANEICFSQNMKRILSAGRPQCCAIAALRCRTEVVGWTSQWNCWPVMVCRTRQIQAGIASQCKVTVLDVVSDPAGMHARVSLAMLSPMGSRNALHQCQTADQLASKPKATACQRQEQVQT